ncbi:MAG: sigma-54-dependent Fis family transcriptional regulator, partial [Proteobacteria bacterium]|nr:sigma-54-dependent Fis family transcriptional regulator [Pseudomonadota bacterium]
APDTVVLLMTGYRGSELNMESIRAGAYGYILKPFDIEELVLTLRKIEEREQLRAKVHELQSEIAQQYNFSNFISQSPEMKRIFDTVKRLANFNTTILITGESGTGKELLARAIHHNSPRRDKPFVAINCGAIPANLVESELFGHRKGSFTDAIRDKRGLFEEASGGTIFLDEIGELPPQLQVKLLRVLQEQQIRRVGDEQNIDVDVRVLAATLRDLEADVKVGRFRDDLFYRLNVVSIKIPALRERPEDIPLLVQHFLSKLNRKLGIAIQEVRAEAIKLLLRYHWRGNVRELENCIERAMVLTDGDSIGTDALPDHITSASSDGHAFPAAAQESSDSLSIKERTRMLEIDLIQRALKKTAGNRTRAARILEISHRALLYKLKEYSLGGTSTTHEDTAETNRSE